MAREYDNIADAISAVNGEVGEQSTKIADILEALEGKAGGEDEIWKYLKNNPNYSPMFLMEDITDESIVFDVPKYVQNLGSQMFACAYTTMTKTAVKTVTVKKTVGESEYPITRIGGWFYQNKKTETLILDIDTSHITSIDAWFCAYYSSLKHIICNFDFSSCGAIGENVFGDYVVTLTPVAGTISNNFNVKKCSALSDISLVAIANGLSAATSKILTLHNTPKAKLSTIMGTVSNGMFVENERGDTTLLSFITQTKGWVIA